MHHSSPCFLHSGKLAFRLSTYSTQGRVPGLVVTAKSRQGPRLLPLLRKKYPETGTRAKNERRLSPTSQPRAAESSRESSYTCLRLRERTLSSASHERFRANPRAQYGEEAGVPGQPSLAPGASVCPSAGQESSLRPLGGRRATELSLWGLDFVIGYPFHKHLLSRYYVPGI